jgi:hypothetical protein
MEVRTSAPTGPDELEGLVQAMTPSQKLRFKQAVVRQSIYFVSKRLPPEGDDEGHRDGIRAATNWLNDPTEEKARAATLFAAASCWDGGVRYHDYTADFLDPAWTAGEADVCRAASHAANSAPTLEREAARQWQIASAQAISRDDEPLPPASCPSAARPHRPDPPTRNETNCEI